jgi:hypothetical protein
MWLRGIQLEEDPKKGTGYETQGTHGDFLLRWSKGYGLTATSPSSFGGSSLCSYQRAEGRGDYCRIGLLESIWKVLERIMDHCLSTTNLDDSLHRCQNSCGTGTTMIAANLAHQLAHLKQEPFYSIFLDLQKAFDTMHQEQCL